MTQENVFIEMACQAFGGLIKKEERNNFITFAKLVAVYEREVCAQIAERLSDIDLEHNFSALIAHNIRARGEQA